MLDQISILRGAENQSTTYCLDNVSPSFHPEELQGRRKQTTFPEKSQRPKFENKDRKKIQLEDWQQFQSRRETSSHLCVCLWEENFIMENHENQVSFFNFHFFIHFGSPVASFRPLFSHTHTSHCPTAIIFRHTLTHGWSVLFCREIWILNIRILMKLFTEIEID